MKHDPIRSTKRRATNVSLPDGLVAEARALDINVSQACEAGLSVAVREEAGRRWKEENRAWIDAHRAWVEENGLPLERYRLF